MLVDSHCHLDFPELSEDLDGVITRARNAGIGQFVTIGTKLSKVDGVLAIARARPEVSCTIGIHPHHVAKEERATVERLVALAQDPEVVGIGESGLDYFYDNSPREQQRDSFAVHIRAAREAGLPLVVHTRDADDDTAEILESEYRDGPFTGVLHCFSAGPGLARRGLDIGFYVSLSGILTFPKSDALRETVRTVPLDRLLVETDSPYLAPKPWRGKRNQPAYMVETARVLAAVKGVSPQRIEAATTENFRRLFPRAPRIDSTSLAAFEAA